MWCLYIGQLIGQWNVLSLHKAFTHLFDYDSPYKFEMVELCELLYESLPFTGTGGRQWWWPFW